MIELASVVGFAMIALANAVEFAVIAFAMAEANACASAVAAGGAIG